MLPLYCFLFRIALAILIPLPSYEYFRIIVCISTDWIFIGILLSPVAIDIFIILNLPSHETEYLFIYSDIL